MIQRFTVCELLKNYPKVKKQLKGVVFIDMFFYLYRWGIWEQV